MRPRPEFAGPLQYHPNRSCYSQWMASVCQPPVHAALNDMNCPLTYNYLNSLPPFFCFHR